MAVETSADTPKVDALVDPCMHCRHGHRGTEPCTVLVYGRYCGCRWFIETPSPEQRVECDITTQWTCPFCQTAQEVGGAATGWMECHVCLESAWLDPV